MKFHFQNYKKIIFLLSILGLLFFAFTFPYNKEEGTLAQGEIIWDCGEEIPIGEAIDEAIALVNTVTSNADQMLIRGGQQVASAYTIYGLDLPNECKAENCTSGCTNSVVSTSFSTCPPCASSTVHENPGDPCPPGEICVWHQPFGVSGPLDHWDWQACSSCSILVDTCTIDSCTGDACDPALMATAAANVSQISALYPLILANEAAINAAIATRPGIITKLDEAREALANCATPASDYDIEEEEEVQVTKVAVSCTEAKYLRILSEDSESCYEGTYSPNFFCCRPVQR